MADGFVIHPRQSRDAQDYCRRDVFSSQAKAGESDWPRFSHAGAGGRTNVIVQDSAPISTTQRRYIRLQVTIAP